MMWRNWFNKWFLQVTICLLVLSGCLGYMGYRVMRKDAHVPPAHTVNEARVKVSEIMALLEERHSELKKNSDSADSRRSDSSRIDGDRSNGDASKDISSNVPNSSQATSGADIRQELSAWAATNNIRLQYAGLDGAVQFDSLSANSADPADPTRPDSLEPERLDLKHALHYDLYAAKTEPDSYRLAFPVVDQFTQTQVGNALFVLPATLLSQPQPLLIPRTLQVLVAILLVLLALLLLRLRRTIRHRLLQPITGIKQLGETILQGDYQQKATYTKPDEIGEVYAVFDQVRERLMAQSEDAEAASRAQKELITNISHDLKTPLATVKAYVEAIQAGICPDLPAVMAYMDVMQAQTSKMAFLIEDLLVHALRDLGQISVEPVEQYSKRLFEVILEPIGHYIQTTGVTYQPPTAIPDVLIRADATRLEQLVSNLVANALKHTGEGDSIRIAIEQQQDVLKVTVADSGEGISPQDMPFIFERYYQGQAHISYAKKFKDGSGLGLSICKHIVEAHQGFISFRSSKGQGTEFYFTLPLC